MTPTDNRPWRRLYSTARWKRLREHHLSYHPLCAMCASVDIVEPATIVDHTIPHRGDEALFWDPENLASLCKSHHDRDKKLIEAGRRPPLRFGADGWPLDP